MISYVSIYSVALYSLHRYLPVLDTEPPTASQEWPIFALRWLIVAYLSYNIANFTWRLSFVPKMRVSADKKAVLITGCDSGFGNLLARKLDEANFAVFACCLFPRGQGAKQLEAECSSRLQIVKLDVTSDRDVDEAYEFVSKRLAADGNELLAVVNNAGILATGEIEFGKSLEPFERQMEVNCMGTIRVSKAFCALLRRCKSSPRLVNVTSLAARQSLPGLIGYCVSKCAALSFTDGIRIELIKWGVQVVSIEPHLFRTNLIVSEAQQRGLENLWKTSRQVTRDDYGQSFFEGAKKLLEHGLGTARSNIPDVVEAMYDSVTVKYPELHRKVFSNDLERLRCWFLMNVVPRALQDYMLHRVTCFITGPTARSSPIAA